MKNEKSNNKEDFNKDANETNDEALQEGKEVERTLVEDSQEFVKSEKEVLLELYQKLKDLGINSIGDLEVKISRL